MNLKEELARTDAELQCLEARKRELYRLSVEAPENEKICADYMAEVLGEPSLFKEIQYPLEITGISFSGKIAESGHRPRGLVSIRPCGKEFGGKTFLGLYLGDYARSMGCSLNPSTGVLEVYPASHNPAIWIPSLERIVFGCESWWGAIESEEQLRTITNETIDGIWYVQALKHLTARWKGEGDSPKAT